MIKPVKWRSIPAIEMAAGGYEVILVPSMGANIVKLYHTPSKIDILRAPKQGDRADFSIHPQTFVFPSLFPVDGAEGDMYSHNGVKYLLPITMPEYNDNLHGTIKSLSFSVVHQEEGSDYALVEVACSSTSTDSAVNTNSPYAFECRMTFHLSADGLKHSITFTNLSDNEMPLGVGFHTALNLPFSKNSRAGDYKLQLSVAKRWHSNSRLHSTGALMPLSQTENLLRKDGLSPVWFPIEWAMTCEPIEMYGAPYNGAILTNMASGKSVYYEVDDQIKHWTLWNNGGDESWICAEPRTWAVNAPDINTLGDATGFQSVAPQSSWKSATKLYVD